MIIPYEPPELTGALSANVPAFLTAHDRETTARHCCDVAATAARLASGYGLDVRAAKTAAWLHDISAVIPASEQVAWARRWGIDVLDEEAGAPVTVHQKVSAWMAEYSFGVTDAGVLSAIGCHTTLRRGATALDKVVFVADKMAWDQPGDPPYWVALADALAVSLDAGVRVYLEYLWQRREYLDVVHPWFAAAYREMCM